MATRFQPLLPGLWLYPDTCHVYVLKFGRDAVAVDFGSGRWMKDLPALGIDRVSDVFLTHHHADQCAGLEPRRTRPFTVHAPAGDEPYLDPKMLRSHRHAMRQLPYHAFPRNYRPLARGLDAISCDMHPYREWRGQDLCLRFVPTPGHGPQAISIVTEFNGRQLCFCGDAAHAGGTIWEPFNLEWDHWTGTGALEAWQGIERLRGIGLDRLLPSHGPAIASPPASLLRTLSARLMRLYRAKGSICAGEKDHFLRAEPRPNRARQYLPHLYQFDENSYLLISATGETLVVDPSRAHSRAMAGLIQELGVRPPQVILATHIHSDHCGAMMALRKETGARICLHPRVAAPLRQVDRQFYLYAPSTPVAADELWPQIGTWRWQEYAFTVAPWPGQTWWHCAFMTRIDGRKVLFGGDSFMPASRWNGTGGFCALNNSRFRTGHMASARLAIRWQPDILANGHGAVFRFTDSRFRRIIRWAQSAEKAMQDLCPTGSLAKDYYALTGFDGRP
ncbi:MAG: MBL fold metallo-hydrolase [Lentisphaerae bacterium]|nr:MBL fold metallo-hydrolase [Lentisphaerota bacterium]